MLGRNDGMLSLLSQVVGAAHAAEGAHVAIERVPPPLLGPLAGSVVSH